MPFYHTTIPKKLVGGSKDDFPCFFRLFSVYYNQRRFIVAEMTAQEAAEWGKTLSFETVWAMLTKLGERVDRTSKTVDRMCKRVDRVTKNVGGLNRSLGELIETLIAAKLWEKFPQYDLKRAYQRLPIYDEKNVVKTDIDILLVDTVVCMAVEVKRELDRRDDVDRHIKRMQLFRQYPPELIGNKQLLGAMAGGVVDPEVKDYAYKSGFYVLELTGESVHLVSPPENFEPKRW
jgi:hypothetical protein